MVEDFFTWFNLTTERYRSLLSRVIIHQLFLRSEAILELLK